MTIRQVIGLGTQGSGGGEVSNFGENGGQVSKLPLNKYATGQGIYNGMASLEALPAPGRQHQGGVDC